MWLGNLQAGESQMALHFDRCKCVAYDLGHSPDRFVLYCFVQKLSRRKSRFRFLSSLEPNEPFSMALQCVLPGWVMARFGCYTSMRYATASRECGV